MGLCRLIEKFPKYDRRISMLKTQVTSIPKKVQKLTMEEGIYCTFLKLMSLSGGFPFEISKFPKIKADMEGKYFQIYKWTAIFLQVEVTFQFLRFIHSIYTKVSIFVIITQGVWVSVCITIINLILTLRNYETEAASLISSWMLLQPKIEALAITACPSNGQSISEIHVIKERQYFISLVSFYTNTIISSVIGLSLHFLQVPNMPSYIYSLFKISESLSWLKYIFMWHEAIMITIIWIKACFIEIFILIFVNRIQSSLNILSECIETTTNPFVLINPYKLLYRIVDIFNMRFKFTLMYFQLVFFVFLVMITHTCVRHLKEYPFEANVIFLGNLVGSIIRLTWIYGPMGKVHGSSDEFLKKLKQKSTVLKYFQKELRCCKQLEFKSGELFKQQKHTLLSFGTLVLTNLFAMLVTYPTLGK